MKSIVSAGTAAVAALVLAGCSYVNPITTQQNYSASDGVQLIADDFEAFNLIVVSTGEGEPGALIGRVYNDTDEEMEFEISFDAETSTTVPVPARSSVELTPLDGVEVPGTSPVMPGLLTEVGFATGANAFYTVQAPVMDGTLSEYQPIVEALD
ncbi:hypothetical protein ACNI3K_00705 [Demequina sp. SO4-13]|uniref:hypothetical protein n=1 Tax=Demequina sp. SO4-13 TaxID=3401027 RepID=UPI003AF76A20